MRLRCGAPSCCFLTAAASLGQVAVRFVPSRETFFGKLESPDVEGDLRKLVDLVGPLLDDIDKFLVRLQPPDGQTPPPPPFPLWPPTRAPLSLLLSATPSSPPPPPPPILPLHECMTPLASYLCPFSFLIPPPHGPSLPPPPPPPPPTPGGGRPG